MGSNFVEDELRRVADKVAADFERAKERAQNKDPQHSGHIGEATWSRLLNEWGPGWPVVTRKYVVGPTFRTNEIDVLILKPDYPDALRESESVLASGVAAAFSVKTTLRPWHFREALAQKKCLVEASGRPHGSAKEVMCGNIPFGILAHTSELSTRGDSPDSILEKYWSTAHAGATQIQDPRDDLDCILAADKTFLKMGRMPLEPRPHDQAVPMSSMVRPGYKGEHPGIPLAAFFAWVSQRTHSENPALRSLESMLGVDHEIGRTAQTRHWPMSILPEWLQREAVQRAREGVFEAFFCSLPPQRGEGEDAKFHDRGASARAVS